MVPAFIKSILENLPNASAVFDRFHIVKLINNAVYKLRKEKVKRNPLLKGTKYILLSMPENLTTQHLAQLDGIRLTGL